MSDRYRVIFYRVIKERISLSLSLILRSKRRQTFDVGEISCKYSGLYPNDIDTIDSIDNFMSAILYQIDTRHINRQTRDESAI